MDKTVVLWDFYFVNRWDILYECGLLFCSLGLPSTQVALCEFGLCPGSAPEGLVPPRRPVPPPQGNAFSRLGCCCGCGCYLRFRMLVFSHTHLRAHALSEFVRCTLLTMHCIVCFVESSVWSPRRNTSDASLAMLLNKRGFGKFGLSLFCVSL